MPFQLPTLVLSNKELQPQGSPVLLPHTMYSPNPGLLTWPSLPGTPTLFSAVRLPHVSLLHITRVSTFLTTLRSPCHSLGHLHASFFIILLNECLTGCIFFHLSSPDNIVHGDTFFIPLPMLIPGLHNHVWYTELLKHVFQVNEYMNNWNDTTISTLNPQMPSRITQASVMGLGLVWPLGMKQRGVLTASFTYVWKLHFQKEEGLQISLTFRVLIQWRNSGRQ